MTRGNDKMTHFRMWLFNHNYKTNDQEDDDDDDHRFWRLLAFSLHRLFVSLFLFVSLYQAFLSVSLASLSLSFFLRLWAPNRPSCSSRTSFFHRSFTRALERVATLSSDALPSDTLCSEELSSCKLLLANSPPMNFIDPMSSDELLAVTELVDTSRRFDDSL